MYFAGIDIGSLATKACVVDANGKIAGKGITYTGASCKDASQQALMMACQEAGIQRDEIKYIVGTGYGRKLIEDADLQVTEITCHAKGAKYFFPNTRTILDIGGQDTKTIRISETGEVTNFAMNDKCAAGTGRFLEVMARSLGVELGQLGELSQKAETSTTISSYCTVFGESEVVSHVSNGEKVESIIKGLHESIASRCFSMLKRVGIEPEVTFTGGVAKNTGMVYELEKLLGMKLNIFHEPQINGALGAAIIAMEKYEQLQTV